MGVAIRPVDPRPIIGDLVGVYQRAYQGLEKYAYSSEAEIEGYLKGLYRRAPEGFLAAYPDAHPDAHPHPVGFIAVDYTPLDWPRRRPTCEIHELVVEPTSQGGGVGLRLCEAGMDVLRRKGCRRFGLWFGEENGRAELLYGKLGFQRTGQRGIWVRMLKEEEEPPPAP